MLTIRKYAAFNARRYGNPWVALVDPKTAKPDFARRGGGYTGGYNKGEAGDLFVLDPQEGAVYMFGQKDYRSANSERAYVQYLGGAFRPVASCDLLAALRGGERRE